MTENPEGDAKAKGAGPTDATLRRKVKGIRAGRRKPVSAGAVDVPERITTAGE
jgi:hypothetical protein